VSDIVPEIEALTRRFGAFTAVDALTLSVNVGEVFVWARIPPLPPFYQGSTTEPTGKLNVKAF
jgi:hypothetical protein